MNLKELILQNINMGNCINISFIVFGIMYIVKVLLNKYWGNEYIQRFIVILPIVIGVVVSIISVLIASKSISINTISEGVLSGMLAISIYKFSKDIVGEDFVTIVSKSISKK